MRKRYAAPLAILAAGALLVAAPMAPAKKDEKKKHRVNATLIVAFNAPFPGPAPNQSTFTGDGTLSGRPFGRTGTVTSTSVLTQNTDGSASGHELFEARFGPGFGSVRGFTDRLFPAQGGFLDLGGRITGGGGDFKGAKGPLTVTQIPGSTGFPQRILTGKIKY